MLTRVLGNSIYELWGTITADRWAPLARLLFPSRPTIFAANVFACSFEHIGNANDDSIGFAWCVCRVWRCPIFKQGATSLSHSKEHYLIECGDAFPPSHQHRD
jgi:hypothetical protein